MHSLYIIYSEKLDRYYTGETPNFDNRLNQHNSHYFNNNYTKGAKDWTLKLLFQTRNREEALYLEGFIKRMKSKKFIEKVIADSKILNDLLEKRK